MCISTQKGEKGKEGEAIEGLQTSLTTVLEKHAVLLGKLIDDAAKQDSVSKETMEAIDTGSRAMYNLTLTLCRAQALESEKRAEAVYP